MSSRRETYWRIAGLAAILGGLVLLVTVGIVGVGRPEGEPRGLDVRWFWQAGRDWWSGEDPYNVVHPVTGERLLGFPYPPQISPYAMALGIFPLSVARILVLILNVALLLLTTKVWLAHCRSTTSQPPRERDLLIYGCVIGCPMAINVIWMGQSSILVLAAATAAWILSAKRRWLLAGVCLALATSKPQLAVLLVAWFALSRDWRTLAAAGAATLVLGLIPQINAWPRFVFAEWLENIWMYRNSDVVYVRAGHTFGVATLLGKIGLGHGVVAALGALILMALFTCRDRFERPELFALIMAITLLFVYAHDYDLVCLLPLFLGVAARPGLTRSELGLMAGLFVLLCLPRRLVHVPDNEVLNQYRVPVALAATLLFVWICGRRRRDATLALEHAP